MCSQSNSENTGSGRDFHLDEHLILDFLQGLLSSTEAGAVLSHMVDCPACERLFKERAKEAECLDATKVLRFTPDGELRVERRGAALREPRPEIRRLEFLPNGWKGILAGFSRPRVRLAGVLAAAVVVLLVGWVYFSGTRDDPRLFMLRPFSFQLQPREVTNALPVEDLTTGLEAYSEKDFERAIEYLENAGASELSDVHETVRIIYLGSALAWNGRYEEAAELLEKVPFPLVPGEWGGEAHWTLYVSLRATGKEARADSLLHILAGRSGEVGERARRLLSRKEQD